MEMMPRRRSIHPVFCWFASTVTVIGWHVPALFALGMQSQGWHATKQASCLAAGLWFWLPVIEPSEGAENGRRWYVPLYLFLATLPCNALGAFLAFCNRVVYPHYRPGH
jgi:cytochrome c oxidase assembly factor CtaG